jgi:3-oxoacyl-[acyl-carrier protein] reductase
MDLKLKGKRVAVAGSSKGLGLAIARAFHQEGAEVWLTGRTASTLEGEARKLGDSRFTACDLETESGREQFFRAVEKDWGTIDSIVLNVGGGKAEQNGIKAEPAEWARLWNLNFFTHADLVSRFQGLLAKTKGSIVSVSSIAGSSRLPGPSAYSSAKAALENFCLYSSVQLAPLGIRYNCVSPGNVFATGGRWEELMATNKPMIEKYILENVPMKRFATPEEIAAAVVFLASPVASFCTGSVMRVDGGQSASV